MFTHRPPEGILDERGVKESLRGCSDLFDAVATSRPRLHYFGHNHDHDGWGATLVNWNGPTVDEALLEDRPAPQSDCDQRPTKATRVELVKKSELADLRKEDRRTAGGT